MAQLNYLMGRPGKAEVLADTKNPDQLSPLVIVGIQTAIPEQYCAPLRTKKKP